MSYKAFLEEVSTRCGFADPKEAERAVEATLRVLGDRLEEVHARGVARQIPARLGALLTAASHGEEFGLGDFYERVTALEGVRRSAAVEHAFVVCQVLARSVDDAGRRHLQLNLPPEMADLFVPREPASALRPEDHRAHQASLGTGRTLASGRPGSARPLSEADGAYAHSESIARSDNPHGDTKISSARGTSQERSGTTLAAGRPGSLHPVSESD